MSVIIRGMEMPPKGIQRTLVITSHEALETSTREWRGYIKHEIIPVPNHGRLIDADVICAECKRVAEEYDGIYPDCTYCPVNLAPAVIEVEEVSE